MNRDLLYALTKVAFQRKLAAGMPGLGGMAERVAGPGMASSAVKDFLGELHGSGASSVVGKPKPPVQRPAPFATPHVTSNMGEAAAQSRGVASDLKAKPAAAAGAAGAAGDGGFDPKMLGMAGLAALLGGSGAPKAPQAWYHHPAVMPAAAGIGGGMLLANMMGSRRDDR